MTTEQIKTMIAGEQYDFLRTNPHLAGRIIFLTIGGSHAYGTNVETSDVDIRGCALNRPGDLLGTTSFEQVVEPETDTTVFGFNKMVRLLLDCNPSIIELLGCKPEHYFVLTNVGKQMIDNRKMFLSQAAASSFSGYATQQLRRLQNALARDRVSQTQKEEHIKDALERSVKGFGDRFSSFENGGIELYTDASNRDGMDTEVFCNIHIDKYPARELKVLLNALSPVVSNYAKLNHRNKKKDEAHLNKHAMHLVRLYLMGLDILEKEEINTYRENDCDFLLTVRHGLYQNEDGTYKEEFFEYIKNLDRRLQYAKANTGLPEKPNMKRVEEFVMDVNRRSLDV